MHAIKLPLIPALSFSFVSSVSPGSQSKQQRQHPCDQQDHCCRDHRADRTAGSKAVPVRLREMNAIAEKRARIVKPIQHRRDQGEGSLPHRNPAGSMKHTEGNDRQQRDDQVEEQIRTTEHLPISDPRPKDHHDNRKGQGDRHGGDVVQPFQPKPLAGPRGVTEQGDQMYDSHQKVGLYGEELQVLRPVHSEDPLLGICKRDHRPDCRQQDNESGQQSGYCLPSHLITSPLIRRVLCRTPAL